MIIPETSILKRENGILTMQDGKSVKNAISIAEYVGNCNKAGELISPKGSFITFISYAFQTTEDFNNYMALTRRLNDQLGSFALQLKAKKAPICLPDAEYFAKRFEELNNKVDNGLVDSITAGKQLANEFKTALNVSTSKNRETGKEIGVTPPIKNARTKE